MQALIAPTTAASTPEPAIADGTAVVRRPIFSMPTPRAAAVAVTGLLAFGVMLGSLVSPTAQSAAEAPLIVAVSPPAAVPAPVPAAPVEDDAAGGEVVDQAPVEQAAPEQQVVYVTEPSTGTPPAPTAPPAPPVPPPPELPNISHVFMVVLSGHGFNAAFGPGSKATYLSKTLPPQGLLIQNYYAVTQGGLANELALVGGQGPTPQIAGNCPRFNDLAPGTPGDQGQAQGDGCVFPKQVQSLPDQLFAKGFSWKAYVEDLGKAAGDPAQTCRHPEIGADDPNNKGSADSPYATWRNPFLYFHSLIDSPTCASNIADMSQLSTDLQLPAGDVPALSYIVPNRCHDGSDTQCVPDGPNGLESADAWLQSVIDPILKSPAYTQGGLIAITFDSAPADGPEADSSSCCGQPDKYPNMPEQPAADPNAQPADPNAPPADPAAAAFGLKPTGGGGKVGLLLLSPFIKPGTTNNNYYNHFSLYATIEDLFNTGRVNYGNLPDVPVFDRASVFTNYNPGSPTPATTSRAARKAR